MEREVITGETVHGREVANQEALGLLVGTEAYLSDVGRAIDVIPGYRRNLVLTSGAPLSWPEYSGRQKTALKYAAIYEGLASSEDEAERKFAKGDIVVGANQDFGCIGSVAGLCTASMPVFVISNFDESRRAFCTLYEGKSRKRLNYGSYDETVLEGLNWLACTMAPVLTAALGLHGRIRLKPLMAKALRLGDELHSRNTAASMLFERELQDVLIGMDKSAMSGKVREVLRFFHENDYTFLRVGMAAAKLMADSGHGVPQSSLVTGMILNCRDFAIRVSGLGDTWFRGGHPTLNGQFFDGFSEVDAEWMGGESCFTEVVGLGAFAQACAPALQKYQGGDFRAMWASNMAMYRICAGEHPDFRIPAFGFRGTPVGIDILRVVEEGITPFIDGGVAGRDGGQIGAGTLVTQMAPFAAAASAYHDVYST